jgi:hypothetical protein
MGAVPGWLADWADLYFPAVRLRRRVQNQDPGARAEVEHDAAGGGRTGSCLAWCRVRHQDGWW